MVTFQTPDGTPGFHQSESLDEAITFVERLRNEQGVHNSRIFRMEELKFDFKPYYKVEISSANEDPLTPPQRPTPSSRPAPPKNAAASLDLTDAEPEPAKAPEPVGVAADSAADAPAASSEPLPPPPPPAKKASTEEPSEPPRRGLFTR